MKVGGGGGGGGAPSTVSTVKKIDGQNVRAQSDIANSNYWSDYWVWASQSKIAKTVEQRIC